MSGSQVPCLLALQVSSKVITLLMYCGRRVLFRAPRLLIAPSHRQLLSLQSYALARAPEPLLPQFGHSTDLWFQKTLKCKKPVLDLQTWTLKLIRPLSAHLSPAHGKSHTPRFRQDYNYPMLRSLECHNLNPSQHPTAHLGCGHRSRHTATRRNAPTFRGTSNDTRAVGYTSHRNNTTVSTSSW
jgi:hypothetical protein